MLEKPHGHFSIHWHGQVCVVCLAGTFNQAGARALHSSLVESWERTGAPTSWVHLVDLRAWEGGTPKSFSAGRDMAEWTFSHGVSAVIRLHHGAFLPRMVDRQGVLDASTVPVMDFSEVSQVLNWLGAHNVVCTGLAHVLAAPGCATGLTNQ